MSMAIREVWLLFRYYPLRWILSLIALVVGMATLTALISIENNIILHSQMLMAQQGGARLGLTIVNSGIHSFGFEEWRAHFSENYSPIPYTTVPLKIQFNDQMQIAEVIGTSPDLFSKMTWSLQQGRELHELDKYSKVIVIGAMLAKELVRQKTEPVLGSLVSLEGEYFKIIGILEELNFDPVLNFDPNHCIFFHSAFVEHFINEACLQDFVVFLNNMTLIKAEDEVKDLIRKLHPESRSFIKNPVILQKALFKQIDLTTRILKIVSMIALFLGFVSMLNQFIIQLAERKAEMGVRLALGATLKVLALQFFEETLILSILAGTLGMILGLGGAAWVLHDLMLPFSIGIAPFLTGVGVAVLIGGFVGVVPAILVLKQSPSKLL